MPHCRFAASSHTLGKRSARGNPKKNADKRDGAICLIRESSQSCGFFRHATKEGTDRDPR
jgi:hypothetical protein